MSRKNFYQVIRQKPFQYIGATLILPPKFDPNAIINANGLNQEALISAIREIDLSDNLWCEMVSLPLLLPTQVETAQQASLQYRFFTNNLFLSDFQLAKRAPQGFWTDCYLRRSFALLPHLFTK